MNSDTKVLDGWYSVKDEGKVLEHQENSKETINIEFDGNLLIAGDIEIKNNKVVSTSITTDNLTVIKNNGGKLNFYNTDKIEKSTLISGSKFNVTLKNLVNEKTDMKYDTEDNSIITIEFYSNGLLPTGHTKESLKLLPQVSVSDKNDIIAYNDNGKLYIVSDNLISFNQDSSCMFNKLNSVVAIEFRNIDTSKLANMGGMFNYCKKLLKLDLNNFNTSNVTNMGELFYSCTSLSDLKIDKFDTSNVTNMAYMFVGCSSLTNLNLSHFDTSKVTSMTCMFTHCSGLTNIVFGEKFNTSQVTSMQEMFRNCKKLIELDVSNFNTSKVEKLGMKSMFAYCKSLEEIKLSKKFDTSKITDMSSMFSGCSNLTSLDVSNFDTSIVTSMIGMFSGCSNLTSLDVSKWNTSNVTGMQSLFAYCTLLETLDVSDWNTSNVTTMYMLFYGCNNLKKLDVSKWNTGKVTSMNYMFVGCRTLTELDVSDWNTSSVTDMQGLFYGCKGITILDLSNFDTDQVTNMQEMFRNTTNLTTITVGCDWVTSTNNAKMFDSSGYKQTQFDALVEEKQASCQTT